MNNCSIEAIQEHTDEFQLHLESLISKYSKGETFDESQCNSLVKSITFAELASETLPLIAKVKDRFMRICNSIETEGEKGVVYVTVQNNDGTVETEVFLKSTKLQIYENNV